MAWWLRNRWHLLRVENRVSEARVEEKNFLVKRFADSFVRFHHSIQGMRRNREGYENVREDSLII